MNAPLSPTQSFVIFNFYTLFFLYMYIMHNYKKGLIVKIIQYKLMGEKYLFFIF